MKLLRVGKSSHVFLLSQHEQQLLFETVKLYPLVPASRHRLSKGGDDPPTDDSQQLLEEALAEQRRANRLQVRAMLEEPQRFQKTKTGLELKLTRPQTEWLLQVLNDVRVGSWLAIGEPEPGEEPEITEHNARYLLALEVCGMFESILLAALGVSESPEWAGG